MTFSLTTRFRLPFWSAKTDVPTRAELNAAFASLESLAALIVVGLDADRDPSGGTPNQLYFATDTGKLWYNGNGFFWAIIGDNVGDFTANSLTLVDAVTGSVHLTMDNNGNVIRPTAGAFTAVTPPSPVTATGGGSAAPGYYRSAEGLITMQGEITGPPGALLACVLTVPRPRDLSTHVWIVFTSAGGAPGFAIAVLNGIAGTLTFQVAGTLLWLNGISYYAER